MRTWPLHALAVMLLALLVTACAQDTNPEQRDPAPTPPASERSAEPPPASESAAPAPPSSPAERGTPRGHAQADTGPGCGQRALDAGRFNPDCREYQGRLDPGGAERPDTAGERQLEYACEQGYLPESEC